MFIADGKEKKCVCAYFYGPPIKYHGSSGYGSREPIMFIRMWGRGGGGITQTILSATYRNFQQKGKHIE